MRQRQAGFELLRIVSMLMVLLVHADGAALGLPEPDGDIDTLNARDIWRLAVESFAIIGVNCFTLISGYFGIRLRVRNATSFRFQCMFYSIGIYLALSVARPGNFSWHGFAGSFMILSHTDLWYVPAYFLLMLLSPLLNAGIENLSRTTFLSTLGLFIAYNLWCGWWWHGSFNPTGYTTMQLIMMYLTGRAISLYAPAISTRTAVSLYIVSLATLFISSLFLSSLTAFAYNSPAVMAASISFFLIFRNLKFQSQTICRLAASAFSVYLIHKAPPIWGGIIKPTVIQLWHSQSLTFFTMCIAAGIVAIYLACSCVDALRRIIFDRLATYLSTHTGLSGRSKT